MKRDSSFILFSIFFILALAVFVWFNINKPRILVLDSYDKGYPWTREMDVGIERVLKGKPYAVRWFYMDTKRHPSHAFKEKSGIVVRRMINDWQPNIIIALDDDAHEYAAKFYRNHPSMSIVFAGINGEPAEYGYDSAFNVTGILERKPLVAVKEMLFASAEKRGLGRNVRIMVIGDTSESVIEDEKHMKTFDWKPARFIESRLVKTFDEWKKAVTEAGGLADYILTINYRKIQRSADDKTLVPPKEVIQWSMENAKVPVVGTNGFSVEDGLMFAIGPSPYEQGEVASKMAVEIIENKKRPNEIPIRSTQQFVVFMRASDMKAHKIELPSLYEAFARATNNYIE